MAVSCAARRPDLHPDPDKMQPTSAQFFTTNFFTALAASLIAAAVTTIGIIVIRRHEAWGRRKAIYFASFAAGVLISVSFLHIIPTSMEMNARAPAFLLAGYLVTHMLNRFIEAYVCNRPETRSYAIGLVPLLGIGFHSFIDGIIYSVTFSVSTVTGALAALGMVLHEFPEGIMTYILLLRGGFSEARSFRLAWCAAALTTPLGMLISYPFISGFDQSVLGALLALSAGALVYVGATHLLPMAEREPARYSLIAMAAGILVAIGIIVSG
jgi:zinc transporter ZupT